MPNKNWQAQRVTIKDIAKAAAVDPSTITRALQGSDRVKPATREKIVQLAADMGYVPNMAARTLVNRRSRLVGVVIPDMTNPFFADLAQGIEDEAAKHGLRILIRNTEGAEAAERDAINLFLELKVDGLLVPMARCPQSYYDELQSGVPVIHINRDDATHHVSCDPVKGSLLVMQHLLELGHRRIGFVTGPAGPAREPKTFAYRQALAEAQLDYDPDLIFTFDGMLASTENIVAEILKLADRPSAVFASVMERIKEIGTRLAIGAKKKDIVVQFLAEAVLISVSGGLAGVVIGIISSALITKFADILTMVSPGSVIIAFFVSASIGVIFGYSPAKRASERDPIESLRHE